MLYILDAYNVIHKMRRFEAVLDIDLRAAREALIALCGSLARARGDITSIVLVFDGRSEFSGLAQTVPAKVRLVFSKTNEDADDRIATLLEEGPDKPGKCVVSDDNSVRNHARAYRANVMSVQEFEKLVNTTADKTRKKPAAPGKPSLPPGLADQITAAYKKALGL